MSLHMHIYVPIKVLISENQDSKTTIIPSVTVTRIKERKIWKSLENSQLPLSQSITQSNISKARIPSFPMLFSLTKSPAEKTPIIWYATKRLGGGGGFGSTKFIPILLSKIRSQTNLPRNIDSICHHIRQPGECFDFQLLRSFPHSSQQRLIW